MGVIKVPTTFNIDVEFEIPEFYRRILALVIDILIEIFYYKIAFSIVESLARSSDWWDDDTWVSLWAIYMLLVFLPIMAYHFIMEITMNGQSVGKRIMNIRVVHENGGRASIGQFAIRWLLRDIWFILLFFFAASYLAEKSSQAGAVFIILLVIGYFITEIILVVTSKKGQRLGDLLAHTILIKTNSNARIEETVFQEIADNYVPTFPQIMQLNDKDINAIKSILETALKKGDYVMAEQAAEKIKNYLQIQTRLSPFEFLEVLLKDYNYLSTK